MRERPVRHESVQFQFKEFGVLFWEGGFGQENKVWPGHRVRHLMLDRGAVEEMGLVDSSVGR